MSGSHREKQMQPSAVNYGMHVGRHCVGTVAAHKVRVREGWRVGCSCREHGFMAAYNHL